MFRRSAFFVACLSLRAPAAARPQATEAVRLLSRYIPPQGGSYIAGCWGWTDTVSGREYAILESYCCTSIVEVTSPAAAVERDVVPGACSIWREFQVYSHTADVISEGGGGVQIINLSSLTRSTKQHGNLLLPAHLATLRRSFSPRSSCPTLSSKLRYPWRWTPSSRTASRMS